MDLIRLKALSAEIFEWMIIYSPSKQKKSKSTEHWLLLFLFLLFLCTHGHIFFLPYINLKTAPATRVTTTSPMRLFSFGHNTLALSNMLRVQNKDSKFGIIKQICIATMMYKKEYEAAVY